MIRTPLTHLALAIAHMAHAGQKDLAGEPRVNHSKAIAEQMQDEVSTAVALLHDVMETGNGFNADVMLRYGVPAEVVSIVEGMTYAQDQGYLDYIASLRSNPIARTVKLADLELNCDMNRYAAVSMDALILREQSLKAIEVLRAEPEAA